MIPRKFPLFGVSVLAACVLTVGCSELSTEYGKSKGATARVSLNGFGAFRNAYANAGFRNRDVTRLSDRVMRSDVIVWTPQVLGVVDTRVTQWFDKWLTRGNRTLVYIVPDSGSETDYWVDAARLAPPEQRLEYRKRAAKSVNQRMMWRLNRNAVPSNGWFNVVPLVQRKSVSEVDGAWKGALGKQAKETTFSVEFELKPYAKSKKTGTAATPANPFGGRGPTGPTSGGNVWSSSTETSPTGTKVAFTESVVTDAGSPIVAEITSKKWKDSKVIVVAGGSLLTNYAFTRPFNRRLAEQIIRESTPKQSTELRAGFLTSNWNSIPVSEKTPGVPKASGMELLTVWPISLVTMHGVLLGLVICLMLLPVFGRPRRVVRTKQSDFGDHLDAVAALMNRAGGERYARARISEYMKRLHGETAGPWVLPDQHVAAAVPLPPLTSKRLASRHAASDTEQTVNPASVNPPAVEPQAGPTPSGQPAAGPTSQTPQANDPAQVSPPSETQSPIQRGPSPIAGSVNPTTVQPPTPPAPQPPGSPDNSDNTDSENDEEER